MCDSCDVCMCNDVACVIVVMCACVMGVACVIVVMCACVMGVACVIVVMMCACVMGVACVIVVMMCACVMGVACAGFAHIVVRWNTKLLEKESLEVVDSYP